MRARALVAAMLALVAVACAGNAGSGATLGLDEPTTSTVDRTTTTAPTGTTARPTTTVPVTVDDGSPTEGDVAVCAHADEILAGFEPNASPETLQAAVEGMVLDSWQADDPELVAATDAVLAGLAAYDVEAAWQAITEYYARCAALGALE